MKRIIYLYKIFNIINGKVYIGQTIAPSARWRDHRIASANPKVPLQFAIKKYGTHNFEFEVIACCLNQDDANWAETTLINQYNSYILYGKGYNATLGGMNAPKSEEWKQRVSQSLMGHFVSEASKKKSSLSHKGQHYSPRTEFKKGLIPWNKGTSGLMTAWNKGLPLSEDRKIKMRKLTPEQEIAIVNDSRSSRSLAKEYGVNKSTILDIRKRHR